MFLTLASLVYAALGLERFGLLFFLRCDFVETVGKGSERKSDCTVNKCCDFAKNNDF